MINNSFSDSLEFLFRMFKTSMETAYGVCICKTALCNTLMPIMTLQITDTADTVLDGPSSRYSRSLDSNADVTSFCLINDNSVKMEIRNLQPWNLLGISDGEAVRHYLYSRYSSITHSTLCGRGGVLWVVVYNIWMHEVSMEL